jgi:hypothetical protein
MYRLSVLRCHSGERVGEMMPMVLSILTLYSWVLVMILIYFLFRIASFYERKYAEYYPGAPKQRTYYGLFLVPLLLFLFAAARYILVDEFVGDMWGDLAFFMVGVMLAAVSYHLYRLMTGGRG